MESSAMQHAKTKSKTEHRGNARTSMFYSLHECLCCQHSHSKQTKWYYERATYEYHYYYYFYSKLHKPKHVVYVNDSRNVFRFLFVSFYYIYFMIRCIKSLWFAHPEGFNYLFGARMLVQRNTLECREQKACSGGTLGTQTHSPDYILYRF